jgi:hypothetical protein
MDVILLNPFHIGDVLFNQKIIQQFYANNPGHKIRVCIEKGHFLLSEIPNIEYVYNPKYMRACKNGRQTVYKHGTLILNMWIYAINRNTNEIECNYRRVYEGFRTMLDSVNATYGTQFYIPPVSSIQPIYTVPSANIDQFNAWLPLQKGKMSVLYMNYTPQSCQQVPITSHNDVILALSETFPDIHFIVANVGAELKEKAKANIFDCVTDFDCVETESCENICKINHIMHACDFAVVFDIGACFTYADEKMFETQHTILHVATSPQFYKHISESFGSDFGKKVRLLLAPNQEAVLSALQEALSYPLRKV